MNPLDLRLATVLTLAVGCGAGTENSAATPTKAEQPAVAPATEPEPEPEPEPESTTNTFEIVASHANPKPWDPVTLSLAVNVLAADFDPRDPAGGTASIQLDAASVDSNLGMRDEHLRSEDYLDADNSPTITVDVSNVARAGEAWSATAKVSARGRSVEWPIAFDIVETSATSIRVSGSHRFDRTSVGIGKPSREGDRVADEIEARFQITLVDAD